VFIPFFPYLQILSEGSVHTLMRRKPSQARPSPISLPGMDFAGWENNSPPLAAGPAKLNCRDLYPMASEPWLGAREVRIADKGYEPADG
jgi:hypothetical protein